MATFSAAKRGHGGKRHVGRANAGLLPRGPLPRGPLAAVIAPPLLRAYAMRPVHKVFMMVKEPRMGAVKTRLGRQIGAVAATWFYRHATLSTLRRLRRDPRFEVGLAMTPDARIATRAWPAGMERVNQGEGDLGARMARVLRHPSAAPCGGRALRRAPVGLRVVIGSDIPAITPRAVVDALTQLGAHRAVFGPADDGGFWLVGLAVLGAPERPFDEVPWSAPDTLAACIARFQPGTVALAATINDVDEPDEYHRHRNLMVTRM